MLELELELEDLVEVDEITASTPIVVKTVGVPEVIHVSPIFLLYTDFCLPPGLPGKTTTFCCAVQFTSPSLESIQ